MDEAIESIRKRAEGVIDQHVAHHEAGHALMAVLLGRTLTMVSLAQRKTFIDSKPLEEILDADEASPSASDYLLEDVKITMAGYLGEQVCLGRAYPGLGSDLTRMNTMLKRIPDRVGKGMELQNQVESTLQRHKESLVRLADALLVEREVTGERARALLQLPEEERPAN